MTAETRIICGLLILLFLSPLDLFSTWNVARVLAAWIDALPRMLSLVASCADGRQRRQELAMQLVRKKENADDASKLDVSVAVRRIRVGSY